jgi:uncharacterized membrane protein
MGGDIMWIIWIVAAALIMYLLYFLLVKDIWRPGKGHSAMDILKKRYVRGDISREEFKKFMSQIKH